MQGYREDQLKAFVVFSLRDLYEGSYRLAHLSLIFKSKGIDFKTVKSTVFGLEQTCILALIDNPNTLEYFKGLVFKDGQKSILVVTQQREAFLLNEDKNIQKLGMFQHVTPNQAIGTKHWTFDGNDYYACL